MQQVFPGPPVSSTNKTDLHDITKISLKMGLSIITLTPIVTEEFVFVYWQMRNMNACIGNVLVMNDCPTYHFMHIHRQVQVDLDMIIDDFS